MKQFFLSFFILVALLSYQATEAAEPSLSSLPFDSEVGEAYVQPIFKEVAQTLVLLGGLDIADPVVMEEYVKLFYCSSFTEKFKSDFEWNKLKQELTSRILEKKEMYRIQYEVVGKVKFERYDFEGQFFPLEKDSKLTNVGSLLLFEKWGPISYCTPDKSSGIFPSRSYIQLNQPLNVDSIVMPMDEAESFLGKLQEIEKTKDRAVYIRFRVKLLDVSNVEGKIFLGARVNERANFIGKITQIDYFYDRDLTKWIASVPIIKSK